MKKLLIFIGAILVVLFSSCNSCNKSNEASDTTNTKGIVVENTISTAKEYMFLNYGEDYRWFESCVTMTNFMDGDSTSSEIENVTNIFQVVEMAEDSCSADVHVITISNNKSNPEAKVEVIEGFWIEDYVLNTEEINVTFEEAYERAMNANITKPHSRQCVLRKEVGPVECNAQYIFGNSQCQIYVDAVTGEVSGINPAYGKFGMPLGEWP